MVIFYRNKRFFPVKNNYKCMFYEMFCWGGPHGRQAAGAARCSAQPIVGAGMSARAVFTPANSTGFLFGGGNFHAGLFYFSDLRNISVYLRVKEEYGGSHEIYLLEKADIREVFPVGMKPTGMAARYAVVSFACLYADGADSMHGALFFVCFPSVKDVSYETLSGRTL